MKDILKYAKYSKLAYSNTERISVVNPHFKEMINIKKTDTQCAVFVESSTLIFAFRGTNSVVDIQTDIEFEKAEFRAINRHYSFLVHVGFEESYNSAKNKILQMVKKYGCDEIIFTGHSLGGALATLGCLHIALQRPCNGLACYTYGSPRVGAKNFSEAFRKYVPKSYRVVNGPDPIAMLPLRSIDYHHVDEEVQICKHNFFNLFRLMIFTKMSLLSHHRIDSYIEHLEKFE